MTPIREAALSHQEASNTYGYLTGVLSLITRYERLATRRLIEHSDFPAARSIFEFGCGTGHFAFEILSQKLPPDARYVGVDITPKMVELSRRRLSSFGERVQVRLSSGAPPKDEPAGMYDRFVANFVLDLLPEAEIAEVLQAARSMLCDGGLLCLASLAPGQTVFSRPVMRAWEAIYRTVPQLVGGCRPLQLKTFLQGEHWLIVHTEVVEPIGVPLEIMVARKRA